MTASPPGSPGPQFDPPSSAPGSGSNPGPQFEPAGSQDAGRPAPDPASWSQGGAQPPAPGAWGPPQPGAGYPPVNPGSGPGSGYPPANPSSAYQPGTPGYPPVGGYLPAPGAEGFPAGGGVPVGPVAAATERIGLGLGAAAVVVLVCCALTAAIYHWGFIASITAWLMAVGASWAYRKVGGEPVKGRVPLLILIVVGIVLGFLSMVASAVWDYYWQEMGSAGTTGDAVQLILDNLFNGELWQDLGSDALFYFLFAALGAFGVIRRMSGLGRARA